MQTNATVYLKNIKEKDFRASYNNLLLAILNISAFVLMKG